MRSALAVVLASVVLASCGEPAADSYDVPRSLREEIVEETAPAIAADNDWTRLFVTTAEELRKALG